MKLIPGASKDGKVKMTCAGCGKTANLKPGDVRKHEGCSGSGIYTITFAQAAAIRANKIKATPATRPAPHKG